MATASSRASVVNEPARNDDQSIINESHFGTIAHTFGKTLRSCDLISDKTYVFIPHAEVFAVFLGMGTALRECNWSEPVVVPDCYVTGTTVEIIGNDICIVGWREYPATNERRIVSRVVMPTEAARDLFSQLRTGLTKGGH